MTQTDWLQLVTAVAAVALCLLTAAYTIATILLFRETKIARLEVMQPSLHLSPQVLGVNFPIARITNVGRGYAKNIRGDLWLTIADKEVWRYTWHLDLMAPSEHKDFMHQTGEQEKQQPNAVDVARQARRFHMDLRYEDGLGRRYSSLGHADWADIADHLFGAQMLLEDDHVADIEKHLESIAKSLHDAVDSFDGVRVLTYRESKLKAADQRRWIEEQRDKPD